VDPIATAIEILLLDSIRSGELRLDYSAFFGGGLFYFLEGEILAVEKLAYSIKEFAEHTSLSRTTVWREIKAGKIRAIKPRGRVLIPIEAAREYLKGENVGQANSLAADLAHVSGD
jgi:excisionase family DNA binding protein